MIRDRRRSRRKKKRRISAAGEKEPEEENGRRERGTEGQYGLAYYLRATSLSHRGEDPRTESAKL